MLFLTLRQNSKINIYVMGENSKIIVVANQKGGVGKSTVCMALANYLAVEMRFCVGGIIDTDFQLSIVKRRKADIERTMGTSDCPAYQITSFNLDNYSNIPDLIEELRKMSSYYIFDTPGRLNHQGIVGLLAYADYIIVPYNYDALALGSTIQFIMFYNNLKQELAKSNTVSFNPKIMFVPVMIDERIGTEAEKELWEQIRATYLSIGIITKPIKYMAEMKRVDTIRLNKKQIAAVSESFQDILSEIYSPKEVDNGKTA